MADEKSKEESQEEGGKKKNLVLFIVIGVVVLLLIVGGALAFLLIGGEEEQPLVQEQSAQAGRGGGTSAADRASKSSLLIVGPMYPMDQFIVNLMSQGGKRYLKTTITLELSDEAMTAEIEKKHAVLRDIIIRIMSSKTVEEISTTRGKDKLKGELMTGLNEVLLDGYIKNLFFTDFVIQ